MKTMTIIGVPTGGAGGAAAPPLGRDSGGFFISTISSTIYFSEDIFGSCLKWLQ